MIHYSIVPIENILENDTTSAVTRFIEYQGCQVEVLVTNGITKINRVISTSPKDYLNAQLQPGTIINSNL